MLHPWFVLFFFFFLSPSQPFIFLNKPRLVVPFPKLLANCFEVSLDRPLLFSYEWFNVVIIVGNYSITNSFVYSSGNCVDNYGERSIPWLNGIPIKRSYIRISIRKMISRRNRSKRILFERKETYFYFLLINSNVFWSNVSWS